MSIFQGKVVWITGASSGIGLALAKELSKRGAKLAISGRNTDALNTLSSELQTENIVLPFDVTDKQANQSAVDAIIKHFGDLDLAILNAGVSKFVDLKHYSKSFEAIFPVNVMGVVYGIGAALNVFLPKNKGHIAVVCSLASLGGLPEAGAYSASKAAVKNFMESLQIDLLKTNIKTSTIYPGFIKTPLVEKNEFPMPFLMSVEKAAKIIVDHLEKEKAQIYFPKLFSWLTRLVNLLPNYLYVRLLGRFAQ